MDDVSQKSGSGSEGSLEIDEEITPDKDVKVKSSKQKTEDKGK